MVVGETLPFAERRGRVRSTQGMLEIPKDVPARRIGINNRSNVEAAWSDVAVTVIFVHPLRAALRLHASPSRGEGEGVATPL